MYSIDNCLPLGTAPSYTWYPAGTPDTIGMDFDQGPNVPGDINWGTRSLLRGSVGELPEVILTPNLNTPAETCPSCSCSCAAGVSIV